MSKAELTIELALDLKSAFQQHDYSTQDIVDLMKGNLLELVRCVIRETHEIRPIERTVDLSIPYRTGESRCEDRIVRLERRGDDLYIDGRKVGVMSHKKYWELLRRRNVAKDFQVPYGVLAFCEEHPQYWPEIWKGKAIGFAHNIHRHTELFESDTIHELCGSWHEGRVGSGYAFYLNPERYAVLLLNDSV